jgi:hypothetical protein
MLKLGGAMVVCAAAAFAVAFFAAGAGSSTPTHTTTRAPHVSFTDPAASAVAGGFAGLPAALKLPPPHHVKHHSKPAAKVAPVAATPSTPTYSPAPVTYPPPPVTHHSSKGRGSGTLTIP